MSPVSRRPSPPSHQQGWGTGLSPSRGPRVPLCPRSGQPPWGQTPKAGSSQSRHRPSDIYYIHHRQRVQDRGNKKRGVTAFSVLYLKNILYRFVFQI